VSELLEEKKFDEFAEKECAKSHADNTGRPSLAPGIYFRLLLLGYFEGIDSERGIAWRAADSLGLRRFLGIGIDEQTPDHSTISRKRRLIDVETYRKVFFWILEVLRDRGLKLIMVKRLVGASGLPVPKLFWFDDPKSPYLNKVPFVEGG
jgi:transposase